jgi:hypothetical protein
MSLTLLTDPEAVRSAMQEYDRLGGDQFLSRYGYKPARSYVLVEGGKEYPSKAIAGVAVGKQHPGRGALRSDEFSGGESTVRTKLEELGFSVRAPVDLSSQFTTVPASGRCWFVGASFGGTDDQTERFLRDEIWEIRTPSASEAAQVRLMKPGEQIAIKAAFVQKHNLPFDNRGKNVSVLRIKARGVIRENPGDGAHVLVDWEKSFTPRDWYFYTYRPTIWQVSQRSDLADRLSRSQTSRRILNGFAVTRPGQRSLATTPPTRNSASGSRRRSSQVARTG